jgi:hypothetical protein
MICTSRGPALAPAAGHTPLRRGEDGRGPGLNSLLAGDETSSSGLEPTRALGREYPAARGRSVTRTSDKGNGCAPPGGREQEQFRPRTDRVRIAVEVVCPM